jgi:hypothetical protein
MMEKMQRMTGWLSATTLTVLMLALAGCGGGSKTPAATQVTKTGALSVTGGTSGASGLTVETPAGVTLAIPANVALTDGTGTAVSGSLTTSVSYSATAADLPAAARALPADTSLVAFADVSLASATAQVTKFSRAVALGFKVPSATAVAGDPLVAYSFDSSTGAWSFAGTEIVDVDGVLTPSVTHLSIWGVFKTATPPPVRPAGVSASGGDAQATLTWNPAFGATDYNIYYSTVDGVPADNRTLVSHAVSGQPVTGLLNGTPYYFMVTAVNAAGESVVSTQRGPITPIATLPKPANTTGVKLSSTVAGQVKVIWTVPVTGADFFNVYYLQSATAPTDNTAVLAGSKKSTTGVASTLTLTGLTSGATYYILVNAENASGLGDTQNAAKSITVL